MKAKTWDISFLAGLAGPFFRATLALSAFAAVALSSSTFTTSAFAEAGEQGPLVHIETAGGCRVRGLLQETGDDSMIVLVDAETPESDCSATGQKIAKVSLEDISSLSLPRKSRLSAGIIWSLSMGAIGAFLGLASGDDPPGWISFTAGQKAGLMGSALGCIGLSIGGTYGALKGVDVDILWEGKSEAEGAAVLSDLKMGKYRCGGRFSISPWGGIASPPEGKPTAAYGGRIRYYFTPRSGLELIWSRTDWSSIEPPYHHPCWSYSVRSRTTHLAGSFFIYPLRTRQVKPFVAWGWGRTSTQTREMQSDYCGAGECSRWEDSYTEKTLSVHLSGGIEIPLTDRLGLESRLEDIWAIGEGHHTALQLGLNVNLNH
jgi:hypothetical protein